MLERYITIYLYLYELYSNAPIQKYFILKHNIMKCIIYIIYLYIPIPIYMGLKNYCYKLIQINI